MYYLYPDLAQSLFQELEGDRHEDLLINVHTLIDLPHFSPGWCQIMYWWLELDELHLHGLFHQHKLPLYEHGTKTSTGVTESNILQLLYP